MASLVLGHGVLQLDELAAGLAQFGTDWLYTLGPIAAFLAVAAWLWRVGPPEVDHAIARVGVAASARTGLPAWTAATLLVLLGVVLPLAAMGFFWDVAWHIDIGRDEFLLSPPHVALLIGVSGIGVAGLVGILTATATGADVAWRWRRWRVPASAAAMVVAGAVSTAGWGIDELWHQAYGIDVTMWSPPHLAMIASAAFTPLAAWLAYAEAGPQAGTRLVQRVVPVALATATLIGLSAWQLEFDLGVPQWQALYQPVLIAVSAGIALAAARVALGRFGALVVVGTFVGFRVLMLALTAGVWGFAQPRFPLYLGAAVAVELAFAAPRLRERPVLGPVVAGLGIGVLGTAGEWLWSQVGFPYAWRASLLPEVAVVVPAAVAAALLGAGIGRLVTHQPVRISGRAFGLAVAALAVCLAVPFPRTVPEGEVTVATSPAGDGLVDVTVSTDRSDLVARADRFGILSWQGQGREIIALEPTGDGRYESARPVPVTDRWKAMVWLAAGDELGGAAIRMPADPLVDVTAIPLVEERTGPWVAQSDLMLREAHEGPTWPAVVAYTSLAVSELAIVGLLVAASMALARRRRVKGWAGRASGSLAGRRVLVTGAASGIGAAARTALGAQGARVVGLDLVAVDDDTLVADVTDPEALGTAVAEAAGRLGGLDVVIANAGIGVAGDTTAPAGAVARRVLDVNLLGAWDTIAAALPHLSPRGHVVVVASGLAVATVPYAAAYSASKRGITAVADVLRVEARDRLDVTTVLPGYIDTAIHAGPAADNAGLDGIARKEPLDNATDALVRAVEERPRELTTSRRTAVELWLARRSPVAADRVLIRRIEQVEARRGLPTFATSERPAPTNAPRRAEAAAETAARPEEALR